ncbi:MAG: hypothetical protein ACFCVF_02520 [Kineosporiaceae bacterium]
MHGAGLLGTERTGLPGSGRAARLRRPSWRDPRLAVGAVLVLGSVALGVGVVTAADDTVAVYAARRTLTPGATLGEADLDVVRVRLDGTLHRYLTADTPPPPDAVAVRTVGTGEIVPRSAVGSAGALALRPVSVPVEGAVPSGIAPGALVDVWIAPVAPDPAGAVAPEKALAGVEVAAVDGGDTGLAAVGSTATTVGVLLDDDGTGRVLGALANGHRIDLVPVPGSVPGR